MAYRRDDYRHKWRIERQSAQVRAEIGLDQIEVLSPQVLCDALPAHVLVPADLEVPDLERRLRAASWDGFSFSFPDEPTLMIVLNPHRPRTRQTATLMEELSHRLLGHEPSRIWREQASGVLRRDFNEAQEQEAFDLGAALLLPKERIQLDVRRRTAAEDVAAEHGCSVELVQYRIKRMRLWPRYQAYAA